MIRIRPLLAPEEFRQACEVAASAWRMGVREVSAGSDLIAVTHAGGLTAGAFEGSRLLGFVHGIPRVNLGRPAQHSHLLAVRPEAQGRGLGLRLKLYQGRWCLERGIRLVTWTFDPLLLKNARLNLDRLGAVARVYLRDLYGGLGGIYAGLPTDRFEVFWTLTGRALDRVERGHRRASDPSGAVRIPLSSRRWTGRVSARRFEVEIPLDGARLLARNPRAALRARLRLRAIAEPLMARGYAATGIALGTEAAAYLFERSARGRKPGGTIPA